MSGPSVPPMPMEWHPAYRDKPWLLDWLERRGDYADHHHIVLPIMPGLRARMRSVDEPPDEPLLRTMTLTRTKAWGPAPYVGDPFVYVWACAYDDVGRTIAGEAHIKYIDVEPWRRA